MELVVDANVVFSFFKRGSTTRELILDPELKYSLKLFAPELALNEINGHKDEICSKHNISRKDFAVMFSSLSLFITIAKKEAFEEFLPKAEEILTPHVKDVPYAALSLSLKNGGHNICLWSNEVRLKALEKHGIKVYSTSELLKEIELK